MIFWAIPRHTMNEKHFPDYKKSKNEIKAISVNEVAFINVTMIMKEFSHDEIFLIIVLILLESFHS
jgi:peroxiredoxin